MTGSTTFYYLNIQNPTLTIASGTILTVDNRLDFTNNIINTGDIHAKGSIFQNGSTTTGGGTATITVNGSGTQTWTGTTNWNRRAAGWAPTVKVKKSSSDTLILKNWVTIKGTLIDSGGVIDATTNKARLCFPSVTGGVTGTLTVDTLYINTVGGGTNTVTISSGDTLFVRYKIRTDGLAGIVWNGVFDLTGDISIGNTGIVTTTSVGSGMIYMHGTANQTITGAITNAAGRLPGLKLYKSGGTLYLDNIVNIGGSFIDSLCTIDDTTYDATVCFVNVSSRTISGYPTFQKLTLYSSGGNTSTLSDTITVTNLLKYEGSNAITFNSGTIKALGDITINNTVNSTGGGTGYLYICGSGTQNLTGNGVAQTCLLSNVTIDKAASDTLYMSNYISLAAARTWKYTQGVVVPGTSVFTCIGGAVIDAGSSHFYDFRIQGGTTTTLSSDLHVNGLLYIQAARTLNSNSHNIYVGGNWDNLGTYTYGTGKVIFNGTAGQYMLHPTTVAIFYDVEIDKASGKFYTNSATLQVNHALTLTSGVIASTYSKFVQLPDNATCTGGSNSSYVRGSFKKVGNDAFTFPLGDTLLTTNAYHPLTITAPSLTTDAFMARYVDSAHANYSGTTDTTIINVSNCEHWNIVRTAGTSTVSITLGWNTNSYSVISPANTRISFWNSGASKWNDKGGTVYTGTSSVGTMKTIAAQSSFGDFTLALAKETQKYFRSTATGNWESPSTWQNSYDNSTWSSSNTTPYYGSNAINVQSAHTVTINDNVSIDQTSVNGTLIYGNTAGSTLTINNGTGTDLVISGTFKDEGPNDLVWGSNSSWVMGNSGSLVRSNSTSSDKWKNSYQGGISTIPSTSNWILRKTGSADPILSSTGGMYYPNLSLENFTGSMWTTSGDSRFIGSSDYPRILGNFSIGGGGGNIITFVNTNTHQTQIPVNGNTTISNGSSFQNNGTGFNFKGNLTASGSLTGTPRISFTGTSNQTISGASISGITTMLVNKVSGKIALNTDLGIDTWINLNEGPIDIASSSDTLIIKSGATVYGGHDSSYVSGLMKKIGNTSFTFPLGDITLTSAAYHPLSISAPSSSTDAYAAKYLYSDPNLAVGDSLQLDSLDAVSDCEYWMLYRVSGSSTVVPTLGWNSNSCGIYDASDFTVAGWTGSRWEKRGKSAVIFGTLTGTLTAISGYSAPSLPLVIATPRALKPASECVLKKKLDAGFYTLYNGFLKFKFDEEYVENGNELEFKIYDKDRNVVASNTTPGINLVPGHRDNRFRINLFSLLGTPMTAGYYVMEVKDKKGEISMLRFKI